MEFCLCCFCLYCRSKWSSNKAGRSWDSDEGKRGTTEGIPFLNCWYVTAAYCLVFFWKSVHRLRKNSNVICLLFIIFFMPPPIHRWGWMYCVFWVVHPSVSMCICTCECPCMHVQAQAFFHWLIVNFQLIKYLWSFSSVVRFVSFVSMYLGWRAEKACKAKNCRREISTECS